ncbi:response regulator [soil metagenome]
MLYRNLMLIDDDEEDQEIFNVALSEVARLATCINYSDATKALRDLNSTTDFPDVIFLDLNMPIMNGQQFLVEIKKNKKLKHIPIIIFSTSSHAATIQITKLLGAHDFITKPGDFEKLKMILRELIN